MRLLPCAFAAFALACNSSPSTEPTSDAPASAPARASASAPPSASASATPAIPAAEPEPAKPAEPAVDPDARPACKTHADCATDACDDTGRCIEAKSCVRKDGGRTCGAGEVGDANAKHESCCLALPIPGRTTKLDKYKITAGRMRAFVERVNGDVRGWYDANSQALTDKQRAQIEPFKAFLPSDRGSYPYGADYQLGGTAILPALPSAEQGCFVGNAKSPAYGSHTYDNGTLESEERGFDRAFLDRLPLNCVAYPMIAAFCAWDGGRVETYDEHEAAWGAATYPWGALPAAGGYETIGGEWKLFGPGAALQTSQAACPTCEDDRANWHYSYQFPEGGNAQRPWDFAYWMSAPGRFPKGAGAGGHMDLAGVMLEISATMTTNDVVVDLDGKTSVQPKVRWTKSGSWEGHRIGNGTFEFAIMTKYGKAGGRCAHD